MKTKQLYENVLSRQLLEDVQGLIGEGVHTGLRKFTDAPTSGAAWTAINDLPNKDWSRIVGMVAAQVVRYLAHEQLFAEPLTPADRKLLHEFDGC